MLHQQRQPHSDDETLGSHCADKELVSTGMKCLCGEKYVCGFDIMIELAWQLT